MRYPESCWNYHAHDAREIVTGLRLELKRKKHHAEYSIRLVCRPDMMEIDRQDRSRGEIFAFCVEFDVVGVLQKNVPEYCVGVYKIAAS